MSNKERNLLILKYSVYSSGILLLFSFLSPVLGIGIGLIQNILFVVVGAEIVLCCTEYKRRTEEMLNYKGAFLIGWQMSFVIGLINGLVVLVAIYMVGKENFTAEITKYKSILMSQGIANESTADESIKIIANPWFLFSVTIVFYSGIGFFLSTIIAFFAKTTATSK